VKRIDIRLTEDQKEEWQTIADHLGITLTEFIEQCVDEWKERNSAHVVV
jgi:hypothetical protein